MDPIDENFQRHDAAELPENMIRTENRSLAHETTSSHCLDFFFEVYHYAIICRLFFVFIYAHATKSTYYFYKST